MGSFKYFDTMGIYPWKSVLVYPDLFINTWEEFYCEVEECVLSVYMWSHVYSMSTIFASFRCFRIFMCVISMPFLHFFQKAMFSQSTDCWLLTKKDTQKYWSTHSPTWVCLYLDFIRVLICLQWLLSCICFSTFKIFM